MSEPLDWSGSAPRSARFDDVYFSSVDGLAESRAVFLEGCHLPQAWASRSSFVVGELGFGTGLNVLALLDLWGRARPASGRLHIFSVEAFPLAREDAGRALSAWPELAELSCTLLNAWPDDRQGFRRVDFPHQGACLDLWIGEAAEGLQAWQGRADAWFLDGFSPARNPQMWRQDLLALVAARSEPGAYLASFTVAGTVRRDLEQAGFNVHKRPGFGRKRERLEARQAGERRWPTPRPRRVAIVGAGIAGASLARAFSRLGVTPTIIDLIGPGAGASGNPAALVTPGLDAGLGPLAQLHAQALARAVDLYRRETPGAILAQGAVQLEVTPRDAGRFDRVAGWSGFGAGALSRLDAEEASARIGETGRAPGLWLRDALVIDPPAILRAWLESADVLRGEAATLAQADGAWRVLDPDGRTLVEAEVVVLAAGPASLRFAPEMPIQPVRGQASWTSEIEWEGWPATWSGYAIPLRRGVLFGASHLRGDWCDEVRPEDSRSNLELLAEGRPRLAARIRTEPAMLAHRASLRAATPDHRPLAGALAPDGVYILSALGGRGFTLAPLLAEHIAAVALGAPSPLPGDVIAIVDPLRYAPAAKRREPPRTGAVAVQ